MVKHLKVAKVKAERISKEKSQNVAEELVFAFGKTLTKRVRMLQDEFSIGSPLGPPPPADCFPPKFDTSTTWFLNQKPRFPWCVGPNYQAQSPFWRARVVCPQTKNRVNQLGSLNFKGWNIQFQDTTFNYTPPWKRTYVLNIDGWKTIFSLSTKKWFPFLGKYVRFRVGGHRKNGGCDREPHQLSTNPKTSTQRLRRVSKGEISRVASWQRRIWALPVACLFWRTEFQRREGGL